MVIYKTINLISGKFYIGKDAKDNPDYLGSGILLKRAILKYGRENFIKVIVERCENLQQLSEREKYWIEKEGAIKIGYNISTGGAGGNNITYNPRKEIIIKSVWEKRKNNPMFKERCKEISQKAASTRKSLGIVSKLKGRKHKEETREKISKKLTRGLQEYPETIIQKITELYNTNLPLSEIQKEIRKTYPCGYVLIKKVIKEFGLSRKRKDPHNKKDIDLNALKKDIENSMPNKQVCIKYGISNTTLKRYLKKI